MCVLTMPGMTYFPVPSMTASDGPVDSWALVAPINEIRPFSMTMSTGPAGGRALP
jgi:hypothetical protein